MDFEAARCSTHCHDCLLSLLPWFTLPPTHSFLCSHHLLCTHPHLTAAGPLRPPPSTWFHFLATPFSSGQPRRKHPAPHGSRDKAQASPYILEAQVSASCWPGSLHSLRPHPCSLLSQKILNSTICPPSKCSQTPIHQMTPQLPTVAHKDLRDPDPAYSSPIPCLFFTHKTGHLPSTYFQTLHLVFSLPGTLLSSLSSWLTPIPT